VITIKRTAPMRVQELVLASYGSRTITCRIAVKANDAAFDAAGDLYAALDDGTVARYDRACRPRQTYHLHQGAVQQIGGLSGGRMLTRSIDGALKIWSPANGRVEREASGLARDAQIVDMAPDGSAVLVLGEDRRLYLWAGEPRLAPYIGPSGPVCFGALSPDHNTLFALKCEGNVELWRRQSLN
jgi:WD40 repeat protein